MIFFDFVSWLILCSISYISQQKGGQVTKSKKIVRLTKSTGIDPEINQGGWLRFQHSWVFHIHIHIMNIVYNIRI